MCVYIWSMVVYHDQTLMRTLIGDSGHYKMLLILLLYPLAYICYVNRGTKVLFRLLNGISIINYILTAFQFVLYNINGVIFLPGYFVNDAALTLNGTLKMNLPWFSNIMILYNFYIVVLGSKKDFSKRKKLFHFLVLLLGLFDCGVVARGRGAILCIGMAMVVMVIFDKNTLSGLNKKFLCVVAILVGIFVTGTISDFFESFSITAARAYSTTARLYAIEYYWSYFIRHPLFGFGFADYINHYSVLHGDGRAAVSDVGIFGQTAKYGLFIIAIYILPILRSGMIVKKMLNSTYVRNKTLFLGLFAYILTSSLHMIAIDQFRMLSWPVFLTIMEIIYWASSQKREINEL